MWDFNNQTNHAIQHRRLDTVVLYKTERKCHLIDIAAPEHKRIKLNEQENRDNYSELRRKVKSIWYLSQFGVVSVVIRALGVTSKGLKDWMTKLDAKSSIELLQKVVLPGTAKVVRQVLEI